MSVINETTTFQKTVTFNEPPAVPVDSFGDREMDPTDPVQVENLEHRFKEKYSASGTAASVTLFLFEADAPGSIEKFLAGLFVANIGAATVTFDLKKSTGGGAFSTVLSGVISFSSSDAAITPKLGTVTAADYVAGDQFQLVLAATAGGGTIGTGPWCVVTRREDPS